jgi:hypothetical protein
MEINNPFWLPIKLAEMNFQLGLVFDKKNRIKLEFFLYIQSWIENQKPVQTVCF